jgi:hypothetical protein
VSEAVEQILSPHAFYQNLVNISETIVRGIPGASSNSRTVNHRFSLITARKLSTFSGFLLVEGLPERESIFTDSQPSLKRRYYNFIWVSRVESSPRAFLIIQKASADECPDLN